MLTLTFTLCLSTSESTGRSDPLDHAAGQLVTACHVLILILQQQMRVLFPTSTVRLSPC